MTDQAITGFDVEAATKRVKAQIHAAWSALIPEAQLEEMARAELQRFIKDEFPKICRDEFGNATREEIKLHLQSPEWQSQWQHDSANLQTGQMGRYGLSPAIADWLDKNQVTIVRIVISELFGGAMQRMVEMVRSGYR
jgi:hypothetical protein